MFTKKLLQWHLHENKRQMPWKGIRDPYRIWISEIILQQTRVDQGLAYYHKLTEKYPDVFALAQADETELYKQWQGLGYYNRCKNMWQTARYVATHYRGVFPQTYKEILHLKGIGPYTAAAISSFAFNLPYAVVDGNVVRVISRYFGLQTDFHTAAGKKEFERIAQTLLDKKQAALYNQAIMDLGATICKPLGPLCGECPLRKKCVAAINNSIHLYPLKKVKPALKKRYFHFLIYEKGQSVFIKKRTGKDIWQNLYTFPIIEAEELPDNEQYLSGMKSAQFATEFTQQLTHQKIHGKFYKIRLKKGVPPGSDQLLEVKKSALTHYAFPKMIISFLEKNHYL